MKQIPLSQNQFALVDDEDFVYLNQWKWYAYGGYKDNRYVARNSKKGECLKRKIIHMHTSILETPSGMVVDHINGNKFDNRKINIRVCTRRENSKNLGKHKKNTSGYKGVSLNKKTGKWYAQIRIDSKKNQLYLGSFISPQDAFDAYCKAASKHHGVFANLG